MSILGLVQKTGGALLAIMLWAAIAPAYAGVPSPVSAYDLLKAPQFSKAELSPSGRYLAVVRATTRRVCVDSYGQSRPDDNHQCKENKKLFRAKYEIYIVDFDSSENNVRIPLPNNFLVDWIEWANDDRLLLSLSIRSTQNVKSKKMKLGGTRVFSVRRDGSGMVMMFDDQIGIKKYNLRLSNIINMLHHDPRHVIMTARKGGDLDLWKVDIETGDSERIGLAKKGTFYWYTDRAGKPILRFDFNIVLTKIYIFLWSDAENDWVKINTLKVRVRDGYEIFDFKPVAPTNVPHQFYVISDQEEGPKRAVKIYDFKESKFVRTVYEHPQMDVEGIFVERGTGEYAGAYYTEDRVSYNFTDESLQAHIDALDKFFDFQENIEIIGFTEEGQRIILFVSGPQNPGDYYLYDIQNKNLEFLLSRRPDLTEATFGAMEILDIPVRDGSTIRGYLTHPSTGKNPDAPLVVLPHGGPERRDAYEFDPWVQYLATRGYQILQVNFRGSDGYGRAFAKAGYGEWGGLMQDDVTDAVTFLHENGRAPADRTCIFGYSYGGYAALMGGIQTPELYQCIVAGGATSDLVWSVNKVKQEYGKDSYLYEYWSRSKGNPKTDKERMRAHSPAFLADRFQAPVLLIHGKLDKIVLFEHAEKMKRALRKAGKEHRVVELDYSGHNNWILETDIYFLRTVEKFLETHLKK